MNRGFPWLTPLGLSLTIIYQKPFCLIYHSIIVGHSWLGAVFCRPPERYITSQTKKSTIAGITAQDIRMWGALNETERLWALGSGLEGYVYQNDFFLNRQKRSLSLLFVQASLRYLKRPPRSPLLYRWHIYMLGAGGLPICASRIRYKIWVS